MQYGTCLKVRMVGFCVKLILDDRYCRRLQVKLSRQLVVQKEKKLCVSMDSAGKVIKSKKTIRAFGSFHSRLKGCILFVRRS